MISRLVHRAGAATRSHMASRWALRASLVRRECVRVWPLGELAGSDHVRHLCGDRVAVGIESLGHVAGGALRVLLHVSDDAPVDVVFVPTCRGPTAARTTRSCATRR